MYFDFVIVLCVVIGPGSSIGTYHVPAMPQCAEIKSVSLRDHNILMAHADGYPVRTTFSDLEMEGFIIRPLL